MHAAGLAIVAMPYTDLQTALTVQGEPADMLPPCTNWPHDAWSIAPPSTGDERAQVIPLLDTLHIRTGKRGRPRKRLKVLAADKGYDAKDLRRRLRTRGIRPQIPKRVWNSRKPRGRPIRKEVPRYQAERRLPGSNASTAAWLSAGNVWLLALMPFSPLP
jgi:hypothetical protein